jgi:hypothetical protein
MGKVGVEVEDLLANGWDALDDPQATGHAQPPAEVPACGISAQETGHVEEPDMVPCGQVIDPEPRVKALTTGIDHHDEGNNRGELTDQLRLLPFRQGAIIKLGNEMSPNAGVVLATDRRFPREINGLFAAHRVHDDELEPTSIDNRFLKRANRASLLGSTGTDELTRTEENGKNVCRTKIGAGVRVEGWGGFREHPSDELRVAVGPFHGATSEVGLSDRLARVGEIHRSGYFCVRHRAMRNPLVTTTAEEPKTGVGAQKVTQPTGNLGEPTMGSSFTGHGTEKFGGSI